MFEIFLVSTSVPSTCMSKVLCSIPYRYFHLKLVDPGFLLVSTIFVADFEALLHDLEFKFGKPKMRSRKLARDWGTDWS